MSNREIALNIIDSLSDEQIKAFITLFAPYDMQAAFEAEEIANDPNRPHYNSFDETDGGYICR